MAQTKGDNGNDGKAANDTVSLKEVVVKGERVMNRDNTLRLLPTQEQKEASATGYGLLSRLALLRYYRGSMSILPQLRLNPQMRFFSI